MYKIGDIVKVNNQDIQGKIVEFLGKKLVIEDDASEYISPNDRLEYNYDEVSLIE